MSAFLHLSPLLDDGITTMKKTRETSLVLPSANWRLVRLQSSVQAKLTCLLVLSSFHAKPALSLEVPVLELCVQLCMPGTGGSWAEVRECDETWK